MGQANGAKMAGRTSNDRDRPRQTPWSRRCGSGNPDGIDGAAPIVAASAREQGALTIAVATKPFRLRGIAAQAHCQRRGVRARRMFGDGGIGQSPAARTRNHSDMSFPSVVPSSRSIWGLSPSAARTHAKALNAAVEQAVRTVKREEDITAGAVVLMTPIFADMTGVDSWVLEIVDKQTQEPKIGADLGFLLLDPAQNVVKIALVQAKRMEELRRGADRWCSLMRGIRRQNRAIRSGSWVWIYRWPASPKTTAFGGFVTAAFDAAYRTGEVCRASSYPNKKPWNVLGLTAAPPAHDLVTWFTGLLECNFAARRSDASAQVEAWLRIIRPRYLIVASATDGRSLVLEQLPALGERFGYSLRRLGRDR
jgi:hypothetical protein